jgi:hypothetical protein
MSKPASLRVMSIAIAVVDAQPGAFHEPQPEAVQEAPIMKDLVHVALLRSDAATQPPDDVADLIDPLGLRPSQSPILVPVHTVFPYGEARAAIYHGADPARLNPLRARSLSAELDRHEAGAKYLMRRVLNLSGNRGTVL